MNKKNNTVTVPNKPYFREVDRLLKKGKSVKVPVSGNSMKPFLLSGDQVLLRRVPVEELLIGQVILGFYRDSFILHRLIKIKNNNLVLAGDGNYTQVEILPKSQYRGVALKGFRRNRPFSVNGRVDRWKGVLWYYLRFLRRVYSYSLKKFKL